MIEPLSTRAFIARTLCVAVCVLAVAWAVTYMASHAIERAADAQSVQKQKERKALERERQERQDRPLWEP